MVVAHRAHWKANGTGSFKVIEGLAMASGKLDGSDVREGADGEKFRQLKGRNVSGQ